MEWLMHGLFMGAVIVIVWVQATGKALGSSGEK